jgi:hypothetical protein
MQISFEYMSILTHAMDSVEAPSMGALPADLRSWVSAGRLLALATEAAGVVTRDPAFCSLRFEKFGTPMMLSLLGYCYATNSFGSEDVEWAVLNDVLLKHFCGSLPDAPAIRRFRRSYRPWILQCLVCLLKKAVVEQAEKSDAVSTGTGAEMVNWASRKIQLAILMDAAAAD